MHPCQKIKSSTGILLLNRMKTFEPDICASHLLNTIEDFICKYLDMKSFIQHSSFPNNL